MKDKTPEPKSLKELTDQTMAEKVATLIAGGMSQAEVCRQLGRSASWLYRLMDKYPEIVRSVHDDVRKRAVLMRHKTLSRLEQIRDQDDNLNAAVKAAESIDARAGISFDRHEAGVTVNIFGEQVSVGAGGLSGSDLRALAEELGGKLGLDKKVIDAEFSLNPEREAKQAEAQNEKRDS